MLGEKIYHIRYNTKLILLILSFVVIGCGCLSFFIQRYGISVLSESFYPLVIVFVSMFSTFFGSYAYEIRMRGIVLSGACYRWDAIERIEVSEYECVVTLKKGRPYTAYVNLFVYGKEELLKRLRRFVEVSDERCESAVIHSH